MHPPLLRLEPLQQPPQKLLRLLFFSNRSVVQRLNLVVVGVGERKKVALIAAIAPVLAQWHDMVDHLGVLDHTTYI